MTTATMQDKALLAAPKDPRPPASAIMVAVARTHGLSPISQMRQMFSLRYGPGKIALPEYYSTGLFDPAIPPQDKRRYVGRIGSWEINDKANPASLTGARVFVADKVMYTALLRQLGLPTTHTQAVAAKTRLFGSIPALSSPAELHKFLTGDARFPLFGKPCEGIGSVGSVLLTGIIDGQIVMGNGRRTDLAAFCAEVFADYPEGFIFQTALIQHDDLTAVAGPAVGTMRVVTVRDQDQPRVLYTVWKIPSPDAMSDNFWQAGSMIAQVDDKGRVGRCRVGTGLEGRYIETHPVSGARFDTVQVPHWDAIGQVARDAHALFPEFGIIGWDMAVTPEGPAIIEANDNPFHALWQLPNGRGIRNDDFVAAFEGAAEKSQAMLSAKIEMFKSRQRAKGRKA